MTNSTPSFQDEFAAVAIDRDKNSQYAVKWAVANLNLKKNGLILVHVKTQQNLQPQEIVPKEGRAPTQSELQQFFLSYRGFCARKGVRAHEVVLHDLDVSCALAEFIKDNVITTIILGASNRSALTRAFRNPDVPNALAKSAPDFCSVYAVTKDKAQNLKAATGRPPIPGVNSIASRQPSSIRSIPDDAPRFHDLTSQTSWKSMNSERSSVDGSGKIALERSSEFRQFPLSERPGSKNVSPQQSASSSKNTSPVNSVTSSSEMSMSPPSRFSSSNNYPRQRPGDNNILTARAKYSGGSPSPVNSVTSNDYRQMTPPRRFGNNISSPQHPLYNSHLNTRSKGSPLYSTSSSSNPSATTSFLSSDMSFDNSEQSRSSDASRSSFSSQTTVDIDEELRRLRRELKQTMEMFNSACEETEIARIKVREIDQWKYDESHKLDEAKQAQEAALTMVQMERQKCKVAVEAAQMAQHLAELEAQRRKTAETRFQHDEKEKNKAIESLANNNICYRKYTIEEIEKATNYFASSEKIGEGGYGPVFKGYIDHTAVAIKVLRPDMSQGQKQFNREVEVLSSMRHPNMVLLVGACPEYGCLVYEYLENGSLEDRLFRKNNTPSLPWSLRFKVASEIATTLLFLHQAKPEPLVHRDLKPANILLDRNFVSKISDVGLSRLVPASIAESVTQYCMTAAAGTFCYIDPEYQQTGMLGTKSDIYSLGMILLQIITAKPPMGLSHQVENAIEKGKLAEILDPTVRDWPVEEALSFAKLALRCCELRRRDRPDLGSEIVPELKRLSELKSGNEGRVGFVG